MQKFILTTDGELRLGDVSLHRQLLLPGEQCAGGGFWRIDYSRMALVLSGASMDYGRPQFARFSSITPPDGYQGMALIYVTPDGHEHFL